MEPLTFVLSIVFTFFLIFYGLIAYLWPCTNIKGIKKAKRVLFVTSHPDDETMFFGPTLLSMCKDRSISVFLLCLSVGDFIKGQGRVRKKELYRACERLGMVKDNITILNYTKLPDNPKTRWREELIAEVVLHHVISNDFDVIVTFDKFGVSGHKNHSAIFTAMMLLCIEEKLPKNVRVFCLKTVNLLRKYASLFDVPMSFALSSYAYVARFKDWCTIHRAMLEHRSQYIWFRKLYMFFSRYVLINTLEQLIVRTKPETASR